MNVYSTFFKVKLTIDGRDIICERCARCWFCESLMQDAVNDIERNQKGVQSKGGVKAGLDVKNEEEVM